MIDRRAGHSGLVFSCSRLPALRNGALVFSRAAGGFGSRVVHNCDGALARGCHDLQGTAGWEDIYQVESMDWSGWQGECHKGIAGKVRASRWSRRTGLDAEILRSTGGRGRQNGHNYSVLGGLGGLHSRYLGRGFVAIQTSIGI